ncbi:3-oxoacyl-acyl carrier protein reductase [Sporothrix brasiliensis 5110]|uniref:3-oxoacyl-acyl carrier protein reductase n=1 Tax=Sporothrix brasiliensis 5110 TaxID=1398154 RepID=A0A0C2IQM6_9PEZI|nr:3-oxoacyl-acyl carrier protein reductase [Sporothrix brasiliensis 5110]KIH89185.1 3-oxoacyl-acyl carrier protein reductase [Sporothrix brasiliensis 5110]
MWPALAIRPRLAAAPLRIRAVKSQFVQSRRISDDNSILFKGNGKKKNAIGDGSSSSAFESLVSPRTLWLENKKAIVTGGSRGIGEAIAERLAQEGVRCTIIGRDEMALKNVVKNLDYWREQGKYAMPPPENTVSPSTESNSSSSVHSYVVGDVQDEEMWPKLFANKDVSILVNAAGVTHNALMSRISPEDIRRVLDTNTYGTILGCREAMIRWLGNRGSDRVILNISSLLAFRGGMGAAPYAASKASIIGLTRALVDEGKSRGIRANVIVPGYIETEMTESPKDTGHI